MFTEMLLRKVTYQRSLSKQLNHVFPRAVASVSGNNATLKTSDGIFNRSMSSATFCSVHPHPFITASLARNVTTIMKNPKDEATTLKTTLSHCFSSSSHQTPPQPLTYQEEEHEKARVSNLTPYQREIELRNLDAHISRLNTLRGINTGELYTWRGKFKALARDYGIGFMVWYWAVWSSTAVFTYMAIDYGGVDVVAVLQNIDARTGWDLTHKVDPTLGTIGLTVLVNELLEPLRLPIVVVTTKPVVHFFQRR